MNVAAPTSHPAAFDGGILDDPVEAAARDVLLHSVAIYDPPDPLEIRYIHATERPRSTFTRSVELPYLYPQMLAMNKAGWNVYIGINPREAKGDKAVKLARCVFVDGDRITHAELEQRRQRAGLPPFTVIVFSGHGVHGYWRLEIPIENIAAWTMLMGDLAAALGTDPKIKNAERIMRLPGFLNLKAEPILCKVIHFDCTHRVSWQSIRGVVPTKVSVAPPPPSPIVIDADAVGDPVRRCVAYIAKMPRAISGQRGHDAILKVAIAIVKFGFSGDSGLNLLADWNAKNADPVFSEKELAHKWSEADRLARRERGKLLDARAA